MAKRKSSKLTEQTPEDLAIQKAIPGVIKALRAISKCEQARSAAIDKLFKAMPSHIECWRCNQRTARFINVVAENYYVDLLYYCDSCGANGKVGGITVFKDVNAGKWATYAGARPARTPPPLSK